jgi:hypothetical protein
MKQKKKLAVLSSIQKPDLLNFPTCPLVPCVAGESQA